MRIPRFLALIAITVLVRVHAQDWYVATTGNDGAAGTAAAPFATINKGAALARAGDTVWIRPGTYVPPGIISPANSGTATAPITLRAQSGGQVVIDARNQVPDYDWDGAVTVANRSWIVLDGLRVINSHWSGFALNGGSNITVRNCSTYNSNASGIYVAGTAGARIIGNSIQRACQYPLKDPNKGTQECITIGGASDFEVAYNTVFDRMVDVSWGGEGIDCKGSCRNGTVHHNDVHDLIRVGLYNDAYGGTIDNLEIYANTVRNTHHGIIVGNEVDGGVTGNVRVHDNLVRDCPNRGISAAGYDGNGPVRNLQIYNNTVHHCGTAGGWEGCGLLIEASNGANSGFVIRNNILAGNGTQLRGNGQSYLTIDRNLLSGATALTGSNAILADPRFVDAANGDFHLVAGSPAIDAALGTPVSTSDHDDRARPQDGDGNGTAIADLGAFERAGGGGGGGNLARNPGFEADNAFTQTPSQWTTWAQQGADANVDYVEGSGGGGGPHGGSWKLVHWRQSPWAQVNTYQLITGLANGRYTLKAWVRRSAGISAALYAYRYNAANTAARADLPLSSSYVQLVLPVTVENGQCEIGLVSSSGTGNGYAFVDDVEFTATSGGVSLPAGWTAQDVGAVAAAGSTTQSNGAWTVQGSGADIWNGADGFQFAWKQASGDVMITARVASIANTDPWAKAGVMVRESLAAGARHADMVVSAGQGTSFQRRLVEGGASTWTAGPHVSAPYWVRLERVGSTLIGSVSANGSTWSEVGREDLAMGVTVYVGFAVTSHHDGLLCTATFSDVAVVSAPSAAN